MAVGPQTVVFALHSVMRLGHAARRAYQDGVVTRPPCAAGNRQHHERR